MSATRHTWARLTCSACNDPRSYYFRADSDRPDAYTCARCPYGHITDDTLMNTLAPGQLHAYLNGAVHVATPDATDTGETGTAPAAATAFTLGIARLAADKGLRPNWRAPHGGTVRLQLNGPGPHSPFGTVVIGARSGKVLRAELTYGSGGRTRPAKGTNEVRALLAELTPSRCMPHCPANTVADCA